MHMRVLWSSRQYCDFQTDSWPTSVKNLVDAESNLRLSLPLLSWAWSLNGCLFGESPGCCLKICILLSTDWFFTWWTHLKSFYFNQASSFLSFPDCRLRTFNGIGSVSPDLYMMRRLWEKKCKLNWSLFFFLFVWWFDCGPIVLNALSFIILKD